MIVAFALLLVPHSPAPPRVTISSLLHEMVDRDAIARTPKPAFKLIQASSYDRARTDPRDPKTWFANNDYGQFLRVMERDGHREWVVMEHSGPGAITRIWTPFDAGKDKMLVRFYFDGAAKPGIEVPFNDLMRGRLFARPPLAFIAWPDPGVTTGCGGDCYFPIPFAKSAKVTMSEVPFYYAFDYRADAHGTKVQTFSIDVLGAAAGAVSRASALLEKPLTQPKSPRIRSASDLAPGQSLRLNLPKGPAAVAAVTMRLRGSVSSQVLRSVVMEMSFDGNRTVWCPIGDFFGCGIRLNPVADRYRQVNPEGTLSAFWVMPYAKTASLRLVNLGARTVPIYVQVRSRPWEWDDRSMLFHATWHHQYPLATRPMKDWNYLQARGNGAYVGDTLTVMNPARAWYGEGDEKVYVDGETFPSEIGTGTEDYYGYAWGMAEHFSSPFIAMPQRDHKGRDDWTGFTTTSRLRLLDAIPFSKSLKFDMEIWHWADCKVEYSAATFWYAKPGATSNRPPAPREAAQPLPEWRTDIKGALECESMPIVAKSDGLTSEIQDSGLSEGSWSNGRQLFVHGKVIGDFMELQVPVTNTGRQRLLLYATKSYDYGIVRISVDGKPAKEVDLWSAKPVASGAIDLGEFDLKTGACILRVEVAGTNPKSTGSHYYFGLDCVVLQQ